MLETVQETAAAILAGKRLVLAGDEALLRQLPKGDWIGGTIPYFMDADGGVVTRDRIFVQDLTSVTPSASARFYRPEALSRIAQEAPEGGFSIVIIPSTSRAHSEFAHHAPDYPGNFTHALVGWVAGVHLDDLGRVAPKVFNGADGTVSEQDAVVLHCSLPAGRMANVGIVNLFHQGDGDTLSFPTDGFSQQDCLVNGEKRNFADYLAKAQIDTRLPLVADYAGVMVNVSIQAVQAAAGRVDLYAPVFKDVDYRFAVPVANASEAFERALPGGTKPIFSCNCILNFLYLNLEGKRTQGSYGPVTFGEIAFQLLNQTLVYLEIR